MKPVLFLLLFNLPALAFAGGSIVGNGGGISEQNIFYAYNALIESIDQCLSGPTCGLSTEENARLKQIRQVRLGNLGRLDMIRFVSEKQVPDFFELSIVEHHRIAKTGLTANDPIFFNADLLYNADGTPTMDLALASAILIHEIGHQSGCTDHAFLDGLGAKVRIMLEQKKITYDYDSDTSKFAVQVYNFENPTLRAQVFFSYNQGKLLLTPEIISRLSCAAGASLVGFEVWNGHWKSVIRSGGEGTIPFRAWIRFNCLHDGQLQNQRADLALDFTAKINGQVELKSIGVNY